MRFVFLTKNKYNMRKFEDYIWLIDTLRGYHYGATLEQLQGYWQYFHSLPGEESELNRRTFFRLRNEVWKQFRINIQCDNLNRYYIANPDVLNKDDTEHRLMRIISEQNLIKELREHQDWFLLDDVPSGDKYLLPMLRAINSRCQMRLVYHEPGEAEAQPAVMIKPLGLRLFNLRWYAVVEYVETQNRKVISLGFIEELTATEERFTYPDDFDAMDYFAFNYGVDVNLDECLVRLKVNSRQRPYIRTLPLDVSQREEETTEDYSVFGYIIRPSDDFARAILSLGEHCEVLEPISLREKVRGMALAIVENNKLR